jgi:hypothetical protein
MLSKSLTNPQQVNLIYLYASNCELLLLICVGRLVLLSPNIPNFEHTEHRLKIIKKFREVIFRSKNSVHTEQQQE